MEVTEKAKSRFWSDLSEGIRKATGRTLSEAMHLEQYRTGYFSFNEAVRGDATVLRDIESTIKASSPVIESVVATPLNPGYNATCRIGVTFSPMKAESVYSDGKTAYACVDIDGKKYVVDNDGNKVKQVKDDKEADDYINNLNKSTQSNLKKTEDVEPPAEDEDGFPVSLDSVIELANTALEGTGVSVAKEGDSLVMRGESSLLAPAQEYLPAPVYGTDSLVGGFDEESGDFSVGIPADASELDIRQLRDFLIDYVNYVIDNYQKSQTCSDDEWCEAMKEAEPCETYAHRYGYKGDSFVGEDKKEVATLVKSLMQEHLDEAREVAMKHMGKELAEGLIRKYMPEKPQERFQAPVTDEMTLLDRLHESIADKAPERNFDPGATIASHFTTKEN